MESHLTDSNFVEMGKCTKPHGIKGGFLFHLFNIEDSNLRKNSKLLITPGNETSNIKKEGEFFTVTSISFGNKTICYLDDISDRNIVEAMLPFNIYLDRSEFEVLDDGEFYLSDLEGLSVLDEEKNKIGTVKTFYDHGAQPVLVIEHEDGELTELPFVKSFFPEINLEGEYIVMINPEVL